MDTKTKNFEFNAPQYLDFTSTTLSEDDGADRYFDTDHEYERRLTQVYEPAPVSSSTHPITSFSAKSLRSNNFGIGVVSSSNDVLDLSQRSVDIEHINRAIPLPPCSARKVRPTYAPELKETEVNGEVNQVLELVEVAHQGTKCQPHQKRCTKVQPFSFEERDRQLQKMKEEKIKKILEEEKKLREFHANPVPNFSQPAVGTFSTTQTVTDPINLQFRTDRRLEERHKREKPANDKEDKFVFKAKPAVVLKKAPFEPKKGDHSALTDVTAIHLNTEERAKKREQFNCKIKERETTIEKIKDQRRQEEERQQMEEIRRMRRDAEHKAAPVPRKVMEAPFKVRPSTVPLTEPKTPKVLSRKRKHQD